MRKTGWFVLVLVLVVFNVCESLCGKPKSDFKTKKKVANEDDPQRDCSERAQKGDLILVDFFGKVNGEVVHVSRKDEKGETRPVEVRLGSGELSFQDLEDGIIGMCRGEERHLTMLPSSLEFLNGKHTPVRDPIYYVVRLIEILPESTVSTFDFWVALGCSVSVMAALTYLHLSAFVLEKYHRKL